MKLAGLIELESEDVLVVCDGDDGLQDQFALTYDCSTAGAVVCVLPADPGVLFVDADNVFHGKGLTLVCVEDAGEVVDRPKTVTSKLEVVGHDTCSAITEVECGFLVERMSWVGVWDVHV